MKDEIYFNEDDLIGDYIADHDEQDDYYEYDDNAGDNDNEDGPWHHDAISSSDPVMPLDVESDDDDGGGGAPPKVSRLAVAHERKCIPTMTSSPDHTLYQFERYAGLAAWRIGSDNNGANEKHGATTMEAKGWRKAPARQSRADVEAEEEEDGDDDDDDDDDMDNVGARRNVKASMATNNKSGPSNGTSRGGGGGGAAGLVVRFRERAESTVLGRSWGKSGTWGGGGGRINDDRNLLNHGDSLNGNGVGRIDLPRLGEGSVPITLADGTRAYVGRNPGWGVKEKDQRVVVESAAANENGNDEGGREQKRPGVEREGCLLGMPMSELVRRADILQRRAIQRKVEREARYGRRKAPDAAHDKDGDDDNNKDDDDKDIDEGDEFATKGSSDDPSDDASGRRTFQRMTRTLEERRMREKSMQLQQRLWVDKHAPTFISHLLSDERTNREVLRALRAWDPYVFGREAPSRPVPAYPPSARYGGGGGGGQRHSNRQRGSDGKMMDDNIDGNNIGRGKYGGGRKYDQQQLGRAKDVDDSPGNGTEDRHRGRIDLRPDETSRVILLSGPPGVGKSTLAHVVCKHAGYRAIEVNASDERTGSALTERVIRAMEGTTLELGGVGDDRYGGDDNGDAVAMVGPGGRKKRRVGGKPNCIILDEIDGADARASIAALVDIIRASVGSSSRGKGGRGGTTTTTPFLRRPIILICNHKYAPALRPILPYARQFDVRPPDPERLTSRLRAVLSAERMSVVAGGMLLRRLVAGTGGDVRSCLYALQFASARARELAARKRDRETGGVASRGDKDGLMVDISSSLMAALGDNGSGMKDMQGDVSSTVATVFRKGKAPTRDVGHISKRQKTSDGSSGRVSSFPPKGVDVVLKAVDHFGDNSKTLDCLWMNVNRVSYVDPTFDRCCGALEWLSGADTYRSHRSNVAMNNGAEHQSMQKYYIPTAAAAVHLLCCVETRPDLTFSTRPLSDCHYQNQANVSLVHRFVEGLPPRARHGIGSGTDSVVSDVIPYGLWLLSAGIDHAESNSSAAKNFLGLRATKAKEAKLSNRAAKVGFDRSKKIKLSNTGSGVEISKVIRFKYQKGFTQAFLHFVTSNVRYPTDRNMG
ncbi:hypothetical protein ACHAXA_005852 [Cyclostephanos tholiformis]|uniref:AAA+ ATPase domain-containing protein n=1 Tax=Cyclostephanos tholiformis TaxID=382380 RepID=A0ABD3RCV6_9STRA